MGYLVAARLGLGNVSARATMALDQACHAASKRLTMTKYCCEAFAKEAGESQPPGASAAAIEVEKLRMDNERLLDLLRRSWLKPMHDEPDLRGEVMMALQEWPMTVSK